MNAQEKQLASEPFCKCWTSRHHSGSHRTNLRHGKTETLASVYSRFGWCGCNIPSSLSGRRCADCWNTWRLNWMDLSNSAKSESIESSRCRIAVTIRSVVLLTLHCEQTSHMATNETHMSDSRPADPPKNEPVCKKSPSTHGIPPTGLVELQNTHHYHHRNELLSVNFNSMRKDA